jgi:hypothetical protein
MAGKAPLSLSPGGSHAPVAPMPYFIDHPYSSPEHKAEVRGWW